MELHPARNALFTIVLTPTEPFALQKDTLNIMLQFPGGVKLW